VADVKPVKIAALSLVLLLLGAAPAAAQPPPPDERAAARAYADAAGRLADALEAPIEDYFRFVTRAFRRVPGCPRMAKGRRTGTFVIAVRAKSREFARDVGPGIRAFRGELANVPTADRVLISGRAAWRLVGRRLDAAPAPGDMCAELAGWRRAGYPRATVHKAMRDLEGSNPFEGATISRKQEAAVDRIVELGVPRDEAELFANPLRDPDPATVER